MEKIIKIIVALSLILMALDAGIMAPATQMQVQISFAQGLSIPKPDTLPGPSKETQESGKGKAYAAETVLPKITKALMAFAGICSFLFLVISGIRFMLAYGNTEAISGAKRQAQWAVIGLLIAILGYAIVEIITSVTFT
ncbi:DUF1624 domain-containing protein [Candidatus Peregrinibacteria bacterium]|nr:DUF1624 domain-containing protein [Candidatus Peregrinibacteria bacterium]